MITLINPFFWINFVYFFIAVFFAFYIPGVILLSRLKLTKFQETVLSLMVGMVLWGWQGFILGYLNLRWFSYVYLFVFFFLWIKSKPKIPKFGFVRNIKTDYILVAIILLGVFAQLTSVWFSGTSMDKGLTFCCGMTPDNILSIAITNSVVNNFPPFEPGYYGKLITNYHYWGNLVMGELVRVFGLPLIATNYQYMTLFISLFFGFEFSGVCPAS